MSPEHRAEAFEMQLGRFAPPEDAIGNEMRIFGPPGTGKTTFLKRHIAAAAERFGPKAILVLSHTRAAAHELVKDSTAIPADNVATLHSVCYRALGKLRIAETISAKWNERYPLFRLASRYNEAGEPTGKESLGDSYLRDINCLRARMVPVDRWPSTLRPFWQVWSAWKTLQKAVDFTDMIEICLRDKHVAPGNPSVIICDEFQDFSPLQMTLVRSWAKSANYLLCAGDDDQTIYSYAGADPQAILFPQLSPSQVHVLHQSQRITSRMHTYVTRHWSSRIRVRHPKPFRARAVEGTVKRAIAGGHDVRRLADLLERHLAAGKTTMLLGSAHFALKRTMEELQRRGVAYANPYRGDQPIWNPLGTRFNGSGRRVAALASARTRLGEHSLWQGGDIKAWAEWLSPQCWTSEAARTEAIKLDSDFRPAYDWLPARMTQDAWSELFRHLTHSDAAIADWWARHVMKAHSGEALYAARVVRRNGLAAATSKPKLTVGTIHSVKGAQADVVYVLPDLTNRWMTDYLRGGATRDALLRLYYVACTRGKEELYLCDPWRRGSSIDLGAHAS